MSISSFLHRWGLAALLTFSALVSACGGGTNTSSTQTRTTTTDASAASSEDASTATPAFTALMEKNAQLNAAELARAQKSASTSVLPAVSVRSKMAGTVIPVYRFFNTRQSYHFYTASQTERDSIIASMPQFQYEGVAFHASSEPARGLSPVHRYYNSTAGVHMYSISDEERVNIATHLPSFTDEGVAYYASKVSVTGTSELRRFYIRDRGIHFYSASSAEAEYIRTSLPNFVDEGPAFYTLNDDWTKPPAVDLTGNWTLTAQDSEGASWSGSTMVIESQYPVEGADQIVAHLDLYREGVYQSYERIWGRLYPDGTLDLPIYAVSTRFGIFPKYQARLNVAGDQIVEGTWIGTPSGTWTAVRAPR